MSDKNLQLFDKAVSYYEEFDYERALIEFKKISYMSNDVEIQNYLGCCYLKLKNFPKAKEIFMSLVTNVPNWERPLFNLGRVYIELQQYDKASECIEKALKINPESADANFYMGVLFEKLNDINKAVYFYEKSKNIEESLECFLNLTVCYQQLNDFESSLCVAYRAYELDEKDIDALYNLSYLLIKERRYSEAFDVLKKLDYLSISNIGILKNLLFSAIKTSHFEIATQVAKHILCFDSSNNLARDFLENTEDG